MREFRLIWMVATAAVVAVVALFSGVLIRIQSQTPSSPAHQTSEAKDNAPAPSKISARILAPTTLNYYRVKVALDGTLQTGKRAFRLYAADIPGRQHTCTYRDGRRWACGLRSYVALVNVIGSDPVECRPKETLKPDVVICHLGGIDLSEWMLREGWARLQEGVTDANYVTAARAATEAKVGIWLEAPPPQQDATAQ